MAARKKWKRVTKKNGEKSKIVERYTFSYRLWPFWGLDAFQAMLSDALDVETFQCGSGRRRAPKSAPIPLV